MKKSLFQMEKVMAMVLILGMTVSGCATTQHGIESSNVRNISAVYIKNAGASSWGADMVRNLKDIDRSRYSSRVDIKVVDVNRIVYTKYNVSFDDAAFVVTEKTSTLNSVASGALLVLGIGLYVLILSVSSGQ